LSQRAAFFSSRKSSNRKGKNRKRFGKFYNNVLIYMDLTILIAGFCGGVIRGLVGFIKHQFSLQKCWL